MLGNAQITPLGTAVETWNKRLMAVFKPAVHTVPGLVHGCKSIVYRHLRSIGPVRLWHTALYICDTVLESKHQTCPPLLGGGKPQMLIGTGGIFVFEQIVRKALAKAGLKLPSSLVSMVAAFVLLKVRRHCCCSRCASMPCYLGPDSIARKFRELS